MEILSRVRNQYNRAPYPKMSWWARCPQTSIIHSQFETGAALVHSKRESHDGKRIGLIGCGTFEPYAFGTWQPEAKIDAVDLSPKSILYAKRRCWLRGVKNVNFHCEDLVAFFLKNENTFDYIHSYGVLHHLENPQKGFDALARALKPNGFARIMVYSKSSRRRPELLARAASLLGFTDEGNWPLALGFAESLPWKNPLKLTFFFNPDNATSSGIIDSMLNACEHSYSLDELQSVLAKSNLSIQAWDFSGTIQNLMRDVPGSTLEKIQFLEAFDQWPAPFTFWVKKESQNQKGQNEESKELLFSPLPPPHFLKKGVYSTLLKKTIPLTTTHLRIWKDLYVEPQMRNSFSPEEQKVVEELVQARFCSAVKK